MPSEGTYTYNVGPAVRAEMKRLRARGCTKSEQNLYMLAYRRVTGRR